MEVMMEHYKEEDLVDYILRDEFPISQARIVTIRHHLENCADCAALHAQLKERYKDVSNGMPDVTKHLDELIDQLQMEETGSFEQGPFFTHFHWAYRVAAIVLMLVLPYGLSVWWMNRTFDEGLIGLESFRTDYTFAQAKESYRGENQSYEDIRLFKQGVITLFDAKTTLLGLFPDYDMTKVQEAEDYFNQSKRITVNPDLLRKLTAYQQKIELIKNAKKSAK